MSLTPEEKARMRTEMTPAQVEAEHKKFQEQSFNPINTGWADKRLACMKEIGWALWYMDWRWPDDKLGFGPQRNRVKLLCKEVSENQGVVSLAYWEHMWEKITNEIENMC